MLTVEHIFLSSGHNFFGHHGQPPGEHDLIEVEAAECIAGRGLRGDRFFDYKENYKGQLTLFSAEVFTELCAALGLRDTSPAALRRNLIVRGADLNTIVGTEFTLQGVRLVGVEECRPCHWMDAVLAPGAEAWLRGRGGLRCRVLADGILHRDTPKMTQGTNNFTAVLLAGGRSARMGRDKALLPLADGRTLLARQLATLRATGAAEILVSARPEQNLPLDGARLIPDLQPDSGPLAGLAAALAAAKHERVLVLAVDLPHVPPALLSNLVAVATSGVGVVPFLRGAPEPLVAVYPRASARVATALLASGERRLREFVQQLAARGQVQWHEIPARDAALFTNWNTRADAIHGAQLLTA